MYDRLLSVFLVSLDSRAAVYPTTLQQPSLHPYTCTDYGPPSSLTETALVGSQEVEGELS